MYQNKLFQVPRSFNFNGIGYINGGMILGEIGDIHRFLSPNKLLAFAGLDPSVYQSGKILNQIFTNNIICPNMCFDISLRPKSPITIPVLR